LFVGLPRSIRSALGDLAVSNSAATLREELFDTSAEGSAAGGRGHAGFGRSMGADPGEAGTITGPNEILGQTSLTVYFGLDNADLS